MKRLFIVLGAWLLVGAAGIAGAASTASCPELRETNTLAEVIEIGLCRNPTTRAGYLGVEISRLNKNAAYGSFLTASVGADAAKDLKNGGDWHSGASASATLILFDFGKRWSDLSRYAALWKATGFEHDESVQSFVYDIIGAYYGLLSAEADLKVSRDLVKVAEEAKSTADTKFKAGAAARADVLKADTTLAGKKTDLQRSLGNKEIAVGRLLRLLSLPQGTGIKIADMPAEFGTSAEVDDVKKLLDEAERRRPALLAAAASRDAAWHGRNAEFLRHLPTLSATGTARRDFTTNMDSTELGLGVSFPLFTNMISNAYGDRAAILEYERAKETEAARHDAVALDVWTAFHNYKTAVGVLEATDAQVKSALESERVVAGMYKVGRATMLDWQTAQTDLSSARRQNAAAKYDLFVKRAALAMSVGELWLRRGE